MQDLNRREFFGLSLSTLATFSLAACGQTTQSKTESAAEDKATSSESGIEPGHITSSGTLITPYDEGYNKGLHHATIVVQDYGTIKVELDADVAPISVSNFAHLANAGFYTGTTFHRIISGFMVQGGAPTSTSDLSKVVNVLGEFSENGVENSISHERGVISMARASSNNSGSSQFFIMHADKPEIDGKYAAFGHVTDGMDVVDKLAEVPVEDSNGTVAHENQPVIESITMDD